MKTSDKWIGWHFLTDDKKTQYSNEPVKVGSVIRAKGDLLLCDNGCHASRRAIDALKYAPGSVVCLVKLRGERIDGDDKSCATEREILAMADAEKTLHLFACWCATQALKAERKAGREPARASWEAIEIKVKWLAGKATDKELDAAWSAAESAAWSAAKSAAESAAKSAAKSAAESAQNKQLEKMLRKLLGRLNTNG